MYCDFEEYVKNRKPDKLGVYYGYAHEGELEKAGADYTVCTVEELYDFFKAH